MPPQSFHLRHPRSFQWRIPTICAWSLASVATGLVIPASQTKEVLVCLPISSDFYQHAMGTQWLATLFLSPAMKRILSRKRSGRKESSMQTSKAPCNDVQQVLRGPLHQELLVHQCDWNSSFKIIIHLAWKIQSQNNHWFWPVPLERHTINPET